MFNTNDPKSLLAVTHRVEVTTATAARLAMAGLAVVVAYILLKILLKSKL